MATANSTANDEIVTVYLNLPINSATDAAEAFYSLINAMNAYQFLTSKLIQEAKEFTEYEHIAVGMETLYDAVRLKAGQIKVYLDQNS